MAFEMNYDDFDPDEVGGKDTVQPGEYHMLVESVDEEGEGGAMVIELQVLRGTTAGQETKLFTLRLKKDYGKWHQRKLAAFAIAARLRTAKQIKENKEQRRSDPIDWSQAVGRSICMKLEKSDDGKWINLAWDSIWMPEDKRAGQIPLHPATVQREKIALPSTRHIDGCLAPKANAAPAKSGGKADGKKPAAAASDVSVDELLQDVV